MGILKSIPTMSYILAVQLITWPFLLVFALWEWNGQIVGEQKGQSNNISSLIWNLRTAGGDAVDTVMGLVQTAIAPGGMGVLVGRAHQQVGDFFAGERGG
jgi:hypothetical protein